MKDWKFVVLWAFILISGELILYGRYYILFYKPYIPFKLVQSLHSHTLGIDWKDERSGWYHTIQYIENTTIEDVSISWTKFSLYGSHQERIFIKQMLPRDNFTMLACNYKVRVKITYHKGITLKTEEIDWEFDAEDAVEVIREETPEPFRDWWSETVRERAATAFPQILCVILLLIGAVVMSFFIFSIARKDRN